MARNAMNLAQLEAYLQPSEGALTDSVTLLACCIEKGVITANQAEALTGVAYKTVARHLADFCTDRGERPAALRLAKVSLESQKGAPTNLYLLTPEGAAALRGILNRQDINICQATEKVELVAAYGIKEIFVAAHKAGLPAKTEAEILVSTDKAGSIRPDVLVEIGEQKVLFEFEQKKQRDTIYRLTDKFVRLRKFFESEKSRGYSRQVRILYNCPKDDQETINNWAQALGNAQEGSEKTLPFEIYYRPLTDFLEQSDWNAIQRFIRLEPVVSKPPANTEVISSGSLLGDFKTMFPKHQVDLGEMLIVMDSLQHAYLTQLKTLTESESERERCQHFFELMTVIYLASHYSHSPVIEYSAFPIESLYFLRRYLCSHQNEILLNQLRQGLELLRDKKSGFMQYRANATHVIWDIFLRWHGFARGEALWVVLQAPEFQDTRSDLFVDVYIRNQAMVKSKASSLRGIGEKTLEEKALAWVLEALLIYTAELGLGSNRWEAKTKNSRRRKKDGNVRHDGI